MCMGRKVSNCIGEVSYGQINYSVDVLVRCEHDGTDDGTAPAVIMPARRLHISLIIDRAVPSSVPSFRRPVVF